MDNLKELEKQYEALGEKIRTVKQQQHENRCWYVNQPVTAGTDTFTRLSRYLAKHGEVFIDGKTSYTETKSDDLPNIQPDFNAPNIIVYIPIDKFQPVNPGDYVIFINREKNIFVDIKEHATHFAVIELPKQVKQKVIL